MKTQSFGRRETAHVVRGYRQPAVYLPCPGVVSLCLKDYREQRENGDKRDEQKEVFPAAGLDGLDIESSDGQGSSKWPDKEGRYWWKLKCKDGRKINDYYWKKDEVRGFPDKADSDCYWFIVHHAPSGTKIEGFSVRPDREKGYPDKDSKYWFYIQYDECGPIKQWMEQKDKNYVARLQREKEQSKVSPSSSSAESKKVLSGPTIKEYAIAQWDYEAAVDGDLSFHSGDILEIVEKSDSSWWTCRNEKSGLEGFVPSNFVKVLNSSEVLNHSAVQAEKQSKASVSSSSGSSSFGYDKGLEGKIDEGVTLYEKGEYAKALEIFRMAAARYYPRGWLNLANAYHEGKGVTKDENEVKRLFGLIEASALNGNVVAQFCLGFMYDEGLGVVQDYAEAVQWYRKAADQGNAGAQF